MKSKLYTCNMCKRDFSRKYNAFRHNTTVHSDLAQIVLNSRDSRPATNSLKNVKNNHRNIFDKFKKFQSIHKSQDDEDDFYTLMEESNRIDSKINKIIGQMIKPYLELDELLDNSSPQEKAKILTMAFCSSLTSYNPVKSLHEISEIYRSIQGLNIIAKNWSLADNIPINQAIKLVENVIMESLLIYRMKY